MEEFLEILAENWAELLTAIGTIIAIFLTRYKKTPTETEIEAKQKRKIAKQEAKLYKKIESVKTDVQKLESMKKEIENA